MLTRLARISPPFLVGLIALCGCRAPVADHDLSSVAATNPERPAAAPKPKARVSDRPANTQGAVIIAEYHHIKAGRGEMFRTAAQFRQDLETYYSLGFRPVLASEYLANKMDLAPGASPIVLTFDDSMPTQLSLDSAGNVDPNCAIGIWQAFAKRHPDFPVHGTFFVLPDHLWTSRKPDPRKAKLILSLGSELANHTISHLQLRRLSDEKVKSELGMASERLAELGQSLPTSMALPFGLAPKNRQLLKGFEWKGKPLSFTGVFLSGASPAKAPTDPKFNRLRIPRILATTVPYGMDDWIKQLKAGRVKPYVQP